MKHSIGKSFAVSATPVTIFEVPQGYVAHVSLVYVTNTAGNTGSYSLYWSHAHSNYAHNIPFASGKSLGAHSSDQFSQAELVMKAGDRMTITNDTTMAVIITLDLYQSMPLYAFAGE